MWFKLCNYSNQTEILNPCSAGATGDISFNLVWRWDCTGLFGGNDSSCTANGPLVNNCGNSVCDIGLGENHANCPVDCADIVACDSDNVLDSGEICDRDQLSEKVVLTLLMEMVIIIILEICLVILIVIITLVFVKLLVLQ